MFFVISLTKLKRHWRKLVHRFLNKFVAKRCERLPPHLNNVSTLPCETWNAHCVHATYHCCQLLPKEIAEFISRQLWSPNSLDLNPVDNSMWKILQEKVYKTLVTDLKISMTPLTNGCHMEKSVVPEMPHWMSHWEPYAMHRGGCLELYYCNMVEWCWWDSGLIWKTNWLPSSIWHCWFGHMTCKNRPRYDL